MSLAPVTFKELTVMMASVLAASLEPGSEYDLGTPEGLGNLFVAHGFERDTPVLIRQGGGSPDFILGLLCGVKVGRNQAAVTDEAADEASRDELLTEIEPEAEPEQAEAPAGTTAIVGDLP